MFDNNFIAGVDAPDSLSLVANIVAYLSAPAATPTVATVASGFSFPMGVAVDGLNGQRIHR